MGASVSVPEAQAVIVALSALLCLRSKSKEEDKCQCQVPKPSKQDSPPLQAAKEKIQKCLFSSYIIKYLDLPSSGPSSGGSQAGLGRRFKKGPWDIKMSDEAATSVTFPIAELQLAQPIHKKGGACLVLDTDTVSNPL